MGLDRFSKLVHQEYGHFPNFGLVFIIDRLVERLQMLHYNLRVAHLDVKPANILIRRGKVTLADFGVCQVMNPSDDRNSNKAGAGTAAYFPQETWRDQADAGDNNSATTCRTLGITSVDSTTTSRKLKLPEYQYMEQHDIYCLGRTLLDLINNKIPGLVDEFIDDDKLDHYSDEVKKMINGMLQLEPEKRPTLAALKAENKKIYNNNEQNKGYLTKQKLAEINISDYFNKNQQDFITDFDKHDMATL